MDNLINSVKRLVDLVYVFTFIWGVVQALEWLNGFA